MAEQVNAAEGGTPTPPFGGAEQAAPDVTFSADQQAALDRILAVRLARARTTWESELRRSLNVQGDPVAEMQRLRAIEQDQVEKREQARQQDMKAKGDFDKVLEEHRKQLEGVNQARQTDREKFRASLLSREARLAVTRVADRLHADAIPLFSRELEGRLGVDEETWDVYPMREGRRVVDNAGNYLGVDGEIEGLLKLHPYMVKAVAGGSGASTVRTTSTAGGPLEERLRLAQENPTPERLAAVLESIPKGSRPS